MSTTRILPFLTCSHLIHIAELRYANVFVAIVQSLPLQELTWYRVPEVLLEVSMTGQKRLTWYTQGHAITTRRGRKASDSRLLALNWVAPGDIVRQVLLKLHLWLLRRCDASGLVFIPEHSIVFLCLQAHTR